MNKSCSKCKVLLPFSDFSPNKRVKSGLTSWCRSCISKYNKSERSRAKSRVTMKAHRKRNWKPGIQHFRKAEVDLIISGESNEITCTCCKEKKRITEFHISKHMKTGRNSKCAKCVSIKSKGLARPRISIPGDDCKTRKRRARIITNNLVALGKLEKQPCIDCGKTVVHAHHPDYNDPLRIEWLCPKHHNDKHWSF